ncbi:hypothetical protein MSAN_02487600 [Mycena sanguinolenta]|uniref:Uncharacterized protein n=1 Tax=Mycena sanguinolenta TaxID=230812 RepID=A0A8H6TZF8_9AGAR|nr:hypothetical protein MSAN_02487600 [Mycena sanguinolenta]
MANLSGPCRRLAPQSRCRCLAAYPCHPPSRRRYCVPPLFSTSPRRSVSASLDSRPSSLFPTRRHSAAPLAGHRPFDDATPPVNRGCANHHHPYAVASLLDVAPATQTRQRGVRRPVDSPRCYCRRRAYATPAVLDAGWTFSSLLRVTVPAERIFAASTPSWVHATQPPRFSTPPHPPASSPPDSRPSSLFPTPRHSAPAATLPARATGLIDATTPLCTHHRGFRRCRTLQRPCHATHSRSSPPFPTPRHSAAPPACHHPFDDQHAFPRMPPRSPMSRCFSTPLRVSTLPHPLASVLPDSRPSPPFPTPRHSAAPPACHCAFDDAAPLSRATVLFRRQHAPPRMPPRSSMSRRFSTPLRVSTLPHISATLGLSRVPPPFSPPPCPTARATACFDAATPLCLCPALFDAAAPLHPPTTPPPTPPPTPQPQPPPPTPPPTPQPPAAATDDAATDDATPFVDGAQWSINARRHQFICVCGGGRT